MCHPRFEEDNGAIEDRTLRFENKDAKNTPNRRPFAKHRIPDGADLGDVRTRVMKDNKLRAKFAVRP